MCSDQPAGATRRAALQERADPPQRRLRLRPRRVREVEGRAVVRRREGVAHHERIVLGEHVGGQSEVAERLRHLLPVDRHQAVVHPVPRERVSGRGGLRQLVLVMREAQIEAAAVDVEFGAEVAARHGRALDVPARSAPTPRRIPDSVGGLLRLRALPEREVLRAALASRVGVLGGLHRVDRLVGELTVGRPGAHVEVHVAGSVFRRVRVAALDEARDELLHLRDRGGRARLVGRRPDPDRGIRGRELLLHAVRERPPRFGGRGVREHLVVDVGDVAHERDTCVAVLQPAPQQVEAQRRPHVPDVRAGLHGGSAHVDRHVRLVERDEVAQFLRARVVEADRHRSSLPGLPRPLVVASISAKRSPGGR